MRCARTQDGVRSSGSRGSFALLVLGMLAAILRFARDRRARLRSRSSAWASSSTSDWDPVNEQFGALRPDLRHARHLADRAADRRSGELRHRAVPHRAVRRPGCDARSAPRSSCWPAIPSIIYGMWGLFVFAPLFADYVQPCLISTLGHVPGLAALFAGPPIGIGMLTAGLILSIMVIPFIAAVMRDVFEIVPPMLEGVRLCAGRHHLGGRVARGAAVHQDRRGRRHHARPGPRARRDHGGDLRDRQRAPALGLAASRPATASPRRSPTNSPRRSATCTSPSLIELGLILFAITLVVLALSKLLLMRLARREGGAPERDEHRQRTNPTYRAPQAHQRVDAARLRAGDRCSACSGWSGSSRRCCTKAARRSCARRCSRR